MNIEITGCNNCPFKNYSEGDLRCNLHFNNYPNVFDGKYQHLYINTEKGQYRPDIHPNCPIPKEGITIKPKQ